MGLFGCSAQFETEDFRALVDGLAFAGGRIRIRDVSVAPKKTKLPQGGFEAALRDPDEAYAALPEEVRAKFTPEQWRRAGEGLARLLDAEAGQQRDAKRPEAREKSEL